MKTLRKDTLERFKIFIYDHYGIHYADYKEDMLESKLTKILVKNGFESFDDYYKAITCDKEGIYLKQLVNEITVNKTDFFREENHFHYIRDHITQIIKNNQQISQTNEIRIWSAACSSGQEPYTLAMVMREFAPQNIKVRILATDISTKVLNIAQQGLYPQDIKEQIDGYYLGKYFDKESEQYRVKESIKEMIVFREFNLMSPFPFKSRFDMVFIRNVIIYFNVETQQKVFDKIYDVITPGGLLFIGHSESLLNKKHNFKYVAPTVYIK